MNISYTTKHHLCLGCGLCEDVCPTNSITIGIDHGEYRPQVNESSCLGDKCGRCTKVCPGLGVNLKQLSQEASESAEVKEHAIIGRYTNLYTGHSTDEDIRFRSASGGLVTGLLIYLIEKKIINGAVVTRFSSKDHITPETFIARTKEELISARSSKYCPVSMQGIRRQIREAEGKYVIVGLPCHLHGFRKIEMMDMKFKEHVFAYLGLYCSSGRTFHLTDYVLQQRKIDKNRVKYFAYRDEGCLGSMVVRYIPQKEKAMGETNRNSYTSPSDLEQVYKERYGSYYNLRSYFIPRRCHFCIDHSAELSDISFGDIHVKPYSDDEIGVNSVIVRNPRMNELLQQAVKDGAVILDELQENTLIASQKMAKVKKNKYGSLVKWGKKLSMKVPEYDSVYGNMGLFKSIIYMLNLNVQYQIGHHRLLWPLIKFTIKKK